MWTEPAALNLNMFQQIVQEKWTMHLWKQSNHMILKMLCHFRHRILAGYVADRYDVNMEECMGRATNRIRQSAEDALRETVKGYQTVTTTNRQINIMSAQYWYAMYPVWVLNTTWKGEKYTFAMNGQTGKMVGDLPADQGAFLKFVGLRGVILGAIIYAVMWIVTLI